MEITKAQIYEAIKLGVKTFDDIKRITRAGMGICQGRTCQHLIERILIQETDIDQSELAPISIRPPIRPTKLGVIADM
jgi:NAD(P)H-nitrite reductase large subunit